MRTTTIRSAFQQGTPTPAAQPQSPLDEHQQLLEQHRQSILSGADHQTLADSVDAMIEHAKAMRTPPVQRPALSTLIDRPTPAPADDSRVAIRRPSRRF